MKTQAHPFLLAAAAAALGLADPAQAASYTWGGGNSNWTDTSVSGWNGGPPGSGDTATINSGTVNVDTQSAPQATTSITIGTGGTLNIVNTYYVVYEHLVLQGGTVTGALFWNNYGAGALKTVTASGSAASTISASSFFNLNGVGASATTFDVADVTGSAAADLTVSGILRNRGDNGAGALTKTGAGTLALSALNIYTGNTTVSGGTLEIGSTGKLYNAAWINTPVVTVASGATLLLSGWDWDAAGSLGKLDHGRARLVVNGGIIEYTGNSADADGGNRNFTIGTGGATLRASSPSGQTWSILVDTPYGNIQNDTGLTLDGAGSGSIHKVIEGSGTVTKTGSGAWSLSGANTYSGPTAVSGGTLHINGTHTGAGLIHVSGGATLGGAGAMAGPVTVQDGMLSPGNSIESLGVGAVTFDADSTFNFEFQTSLFAGAPNVAADLVYSTGALSITPGALLTLTELGPSTALAIGSKLTLISYSGSAPAGVFTHGGAPLSDGGIITMGANTWQFKYADASGGPNFDADQAGAGNYFTMTVVPEAGAAGLLALGLLLVRLLRRRTTRA